MAGNTPPAEGQLTDHRYTWDVAAGLPVVLQDGTNTYVYGLDLIASVTGTTPTYYLTDGLGSTRGLTNSQGQQTMTYSYDAFGAMRTQTGSSANYWLFTGEQRDSQTGMYYLRARYYDPTVGRFVSQDPLAGLLAVPQSLNRYPYVLNNPLLYRDPYGYWPSLGDMWDKTKDVAGAVGGGFAEGAEWANENVVQPVIDAADYCIDRPGECAARGGMVLLGTVEIVGGVAIGTTMCFGSAAMLSPTGPGGWALVGVVCMEGGVAAVAGGTVGFLDIRHAVSPWHEEADPSGGAARGGTAGTARRHPGKE